MHKYTNYKFSSILNIVIEILIKQLVTFYIDSDVFKYQNNSPFFDKRNWIDHVIKLNTLFKEDIIAIEEISNDWERQQMS